MGFPTGDIKLSANFELNVSKPLDARNVVTNFSDLANISFKYAGMIVFVIATNKHYGLKNNLTTWEVINSGTSGSGGGGSSSAGNGLTISSSVIQLGGTLTNTLTSINLNNKALRFTNGANTLMNIDEGLLYDNANKESVDTVNRFLKDNTEKIGLNWNTRVLSDKSTTPKTSIHWQNRTMNSTTGVVVADWNNSLNMNADIKFGSGTNKALKGTSVYFSNYNNELRLSETGKYGLYLQSFLSSNANVRGVLNISGISIDSGVYDASSNAGNISVTPNLVTISSASASNSTQLALEATQLKFKTNNTANYAIFKTTNITSTNRTFEYPNNSGTIALTSDLYQSGTNFFLPISGGTMLGNITMGYNRLLKGSSKTTPSFGNQNWDNIINISNNGTLAGMNMSATNRANTAIYTNVTMNSGYQVQVGAVGGSGIMFLNKTNYYVNTLNTGFNQSSQGIYISTTNGDPNPYTEEHSFYYFNTDGMKISTRAGYAGLYGYRFATLKTDNLYQFNRTYQFPDQSGTFALIENLPNNGTNFVQINNGSILIDNSSTPNYFAITSDNGAYNTPWFEMDNTFFFLGDDNSNVSFNSWTTNQVDIKNTVGNIKLETDNTHNVELTVNNTELMVNNIGVNIKSNSSNFASLHTTNLSTDRNFEFPDQSGTIALIENITDTSLINNTYYVSVSHGNDTTGQKGNILKPFKSIKTAVNASTAGDVVHVFSGLYDEYHIPTKSYLTIHLEDGVIIEPTFNGGSVSIFSDLVLGQAAYKFRITGKGEILCNGQAGNDTTALVASYANSKYFIEAKKVRSMEAWGQVGAYIYVKDAIIDFEAEAYSGGELYLENCNFINYGSVVYGYSDTLGNNPYKYTYKNCYFERNGVNYDYLNTYGTDALHVLYIAPVYPSTEHGNIIFDNCDFVQKVMNNDIMYIQSSNYDSSSGIQFNDCKFYNIDNTKKSIVFTTNEFVYAPIGASQSDSYENGNLKFFFQNNISNVDVDNVNTLYPMTNQLPSSGFLINSYFKLNSKFIA